MATKKTQKQKVHSNPIFGYYVYRILGVKIANVLAKTPITPNQVTFISLILGLAACVLYLGGTQKHLMYGAIVFYLSKLFDYADGQVARIKGMTSKLGAWLDTYSDVYKITLPLIAIAIGNYLITKELKVLILGFTGAVLFLLFMVTRLMHLVMVKKEGGADYQITPHTHLGWMTPASILIIVLTLFNQPYYLLLFFGTVGVIPLLIKLQTSYYAIKALDHRK